MFHRTELLKEWVLFTKFALLLSSKQNLNFHKNTTY